MKIDLVDFCEICCIDFSEILRICALQWADSANLRQKARFLDSAILRILCKIAESSAIAESSGKI
ncbi:hypothetical protein ACWIUD_09065 [Helicobacter sp. 23-1044]